MTALAFTLFLVLIAFGNRLIGWHDDTGAVQVALAIAFVLGFLAAPR